MKLSGAQVTRINEELIRMEWNAKRESRDGYSHTRTIGDRHRAIEDFVEVLVNEILLTDGVRLISLGCAMTGTLGEDA